MMNDFSEIMTLEETTKYLKIGKSTTRKRSGSTVHSGITGHKSSRTTEVCTHVSNRDLSQIKSSLDRLFENKEGDDIKDD